MVIDKIVFETIRNSNIDRYKEMQNEFEKFISIWKNITMGLKKYMTISIWDDKEYYLYSGSDFISYTCDYHDYDNDPTIYIDDISQKHLHNIICNLDSNLKNFFKEIQNNTQITINDKSKIMRINAKLSEI